jgi:undecaprenyl-diphosphatase
VLAALWRRPWVFGLVLAADALADLIARALKLTTDERRPAARFPDLHPLVSVPHDASFPSGHTATSFACATVLSVAAPRYALAFFALACAIAYSRLYVAVHYPLDVLGGAVVGVLVAAALLAAFRRRDGADVGPRSWLRPPA